MTNIIYVSLIVYNIFKVYSENKFNFSGSNEYFKNTSLFDEFLSNIFFNSSNLILYSKFKFNIFLKIIV